MDFRDLITYHAEFSLEISWSICGFQESVLSNVKPKNLV